jgi:hypothetical protein
MTITFARGNNNAGMENESRGSSQEWILDFKIREAQDPELQ